MYHINPQWLDYDEYFEDGKGFVLTDISEEKIRQFSSLESITFNLYHNPNEQVVKKIESLGIKVNV